MAAAKRSHVWIQESRQIILTWNLLVPIPNIRERIWLEQWILAKVGGGKLIVWMELGKFLEERGDKPMPSGLCKETHN